MTTQIKVLMLENNPADARLNEEELSDAGFTCSSRRVETKEDYAKELERFKPDVILADYRLPRFDALSALRLAQERYAFIPFIIVTGVLDERAAVELLRAGASDYVLKDHLLRLGPAVKKAFEIKKAKEEKAVAESKLLKSYAELEQRVAERTESLSMINKELMESEHYVLELVETANSVILRWFPDGKIFFANRFALNFFGYRKDELLGQSIAILVPQVPDAQNLVERLVRDISDKPEKYGGFEIEQIRKDGSRAWVSWSKKAIRDKNGAIREILCVGNDITSLKETQAELERNRERLSQILSSISDGFFVLDKQWRFSYINPRAARNVSKKPEEMIGKNIWLEFPFLVENKYDVSYRHAMEKREQTEFEMADPFKHERWYNIKIYPAAEGVTVYWTDVTDKKTAQEKRIKDILNLALNMAHEIRSPLSVIKTGSYNIYKKCSGQDIKRSYDNINYKIDEINAILKELLDYTGLNIINMEPIKLLDILKEVVESNRTKYKDYSVRVVMDIDFKDMVLNADKKQVRQLLNNLIENSFESFTKKTGVLKISGRYDDNSVYISIGDNGAGMDKEVLDKIFEPFITTKLHGIGLGMPTCQQIVKNHNGKITVESTKGKGTTVRVTLPVTALVSSI